MWKESWLFGWLRQFSIVELKSFKIYYHGLPRLGQTEACVVRYSLVKPLEVRDNNLCISKGKQMQRKIVPTKNFPPIYTLSTLKRELNHGKCFLSCRSMSKMPRFYLSKTQYLYRNVYQNGNSKKNYLFAFEFCHCDKVNNRTKAADNFDGCAPRS